VPGHGIVGRVKLHSPGRYAASPPAGYYAMGAGIAGFLIHLFIWRMIWRLGLALWRIPTFGPVIVCLLLLGVVALGVLRAANGGRWPWRRSRGGIFGYGNGNGPRDW
jgi:hypothetical protein